MIKALFPASFDPIHNGHIDIINRAANIFDEVVVGIYDLPQKKLLFHLEERLVMVEDILKNRPKISIVTYGGLTVNFCREIGAKVILRGLRVFSDFEHEFRLALSNSELAPDIETLSFITNKQHSFLSSSTVREIAMLGGDVSSMVPPNVVKSLSEKRESLGK
jgi:pantetheine-phosphate adenylyltransferase